MRSNIIISPVIIILVGSLNMLSQSSQPNTEIDKLSAQLSQLQEHDRIKTLNQLALLLLKKDNQQAMKYSSEALKLSRHLQDAAQEGRALRYQARGYWYMDQIQEAFRAITNAITIHSRINDQANLRDDYEVMAYFQLAIGNYTESLRHNLEYLRLSRDLKDEKNIAMALYQLGRVYLNLKDYEQALEYYQKGMKIARNLRESRTSYFLNNIGIVYEKLGQYEKARDYYQNSLNITVKNQSNKNMMSNALLNLGIVYGKLNQFRMAHSYLNRAKDFFKNRNNKTGLATTLFRSGDLYSKERRYSEAESQYFQALKIIKNRDNKILKEMIHNSLSEFYHSTGQYQLALFHHQRYSKIKDERIDERKNKQFLELQERYQAFTRQQEIEILKQKDQIRTLYTNMIILAFFIVLLLLIFIFKKYLHLFAFWKKEKYFGQYRTLELLGEGGMGSVYKGCHVRDKNSLVAIKVLKDSLFNLEVQRKRFKREGIIIDQLNHPNIVKIHERSELKDKMYMVMEFVEGITLEQMMVKEGQVSLPTFIHIMKQLTAALSAIHIKNILHRDLTPANIMLTETENGYRVKLLDFGLSKMTNQSRLTRTGFIVGTVNYLAPEQILENVNSPASDIYSLGVIAYELLAGRQAFQGDTIPRVIDQIITQPPPALKQYRQDLPQNLIDLIEAMMAKDQGARPNITAVVENLDNLYHSNF